MCLCVWMSMATLFVWVCTAYVRACQDPVWALRIVLDWSPAYVLCQGHPAEPQSSTIRLHWLLSLSWEPSLPPENLNCRWPPGLLHYIKTCSPTICGLEVGSENQHGNDSEVWLLIKQKMNLNMYLARFVIEKVCFLKFELSWALGLSCCIWKLNSRCDIWFVYYFFFFFPFFLIFKQNLIFQDLKIGHTKLQFLWRYSFMKLGLTKLYFSFLFPFFYQSCLWLTVSPSSELSTLDSRLKIEINYSSQKPSAIRNHLNFDFYLKDPVIGWMCAAFLWNRLKNLETKFTLLAVIFMKLVNNLLLASTWRQMMLRIPYGHKDPSRLSY